MALKFFLSAVIFLSNSALVRNRHYQLPGIHWQVKEYASHKCLEILAGFLVQVFSTSFDLKAGGGPQQAFFCIPSNSVCKEIKHLAVIQIAPLHTLIQFFLRV